MKKFPAFLLALALVILCGCAETPAGNSTAGTTTAPTQVTTPSTKPTEPSYTNPKPTETEPTPTETEPLPTETEPVILYTNPLTGEALSELSENRPYAIVLNNNKAAMPQHGIGSADVLIETLAEGGITRCLGIYHDISDVNAFGSIRSARLYFVQLAQGFDSILVHAGGSGEADAYLSNTGWDDLDGVGGANASKYFYRDQSRLNAGYSLEHTMFIKSSGIESYAKKLGYATTRTGGVNFGWQFGDSSAVTGQSAGSMTVHFGSGSGSKSTSLAYNATDGLYYASQYGTAHIDGATGQQQRYRNILVLKTSIKNQGDGSGLLTISTTGSGSGYYACDGKLIPIQWSRASVNSPFVFTTEAGEPIVLGVGKTYLAIVPNNALFKNS